MKTKVIATILTALTLLNPVFAAYTLGDYPGFLFDEDRNLAAYVVYGNDAAISDVVGGTDLAVRLAAESYETVSTGGDSTTVTGGESENVAIGKALTASSYLDSSFTDDDLVGLQDSVLTFQTDNFNFHDEVVLGTSTPSIESSYSGAEPDYGSGVYMEATSGAFSYYYVFDEAINISTATSDQPLEIDFMGKTLKITGVDSSIPDTKFDAYVGDTYSMSIGDSVTVEGKVVTLENVASSGNTVRVSIDGTLYTVTNTQTKGGVQISVLSTFYAETLSERGATLVMGKQASASYGNDDVYYKDNSVCNDDPNDTDCWKWVINGLRANAAGDKLSTNVGPTLGVQSDFILASKEANPVTAGGCYKYPNGYAEVCFNSLTVEDDKYMTLQMSKRTSQNLGGTTFDTWYIQAGDAQGIELNDSSLAGISSSKRTQEVWLVPNTSTWSVWYRDTDGSKATAGETTANFFASVYYGDTKTENVRLYIANNSGFTMSNITMYIVGKTTTDLSDERLIYPITHTASAVTSLGASASAEEASELVYYSGSGAETTIGTRDEDGRTKYGIVVLDPKSNGPSDRVSLKVPNEQVFAKVVVKGPGTTVTTAAGDVVKNVVPITTAVAKLDTEVSLPVKKHLVLVGSAAINRLSAEVMGLDYPTYGSSGSFPFESGEAYIKVYEDVLEDGYVAVLVAGWDAEDTRNACSVLQQYETFASQLDDNVAVKVTSVSAAGITAAVDEVTTTTVAEE
jgi:hypothetical protein